MLVNPDKLKDILYQLAVGAGAGEYEAKILSDSTVQAELRGMSSHGVVRYPSYIERISLGLYAVKTEPEVITDAGSLLLIDGKNGIGAPLAMRAMELCVARASQTGACFAGVNHGNHFGCGAYYTQYAASKGMIGFAAANANAWVTPFGGAQKKLGTNPLAIAVPCGDKEPLVVDMATSEAAHGKVLVCAKKGIPVPLGWGIDSEGNAATDPQAILNGGALLPFGGAKGYGISLVIELLCSALAGGKRSTEMGSMFARDQVIGTGFFIGAIDAGKLVDPETFAARVDDILEDMRDAGTEEKPVYIPGEIEANKARLAGENGIEIAPAIFEDLSRLAERYGAAMDIQM